MEKELEYFEPDSENFNIYKALFHKQSHDVCRKEINKEWINTSSREFSFCYAFIGLKAQLGRRSLKKIEDKYILKAFITCRVMKEAKVLKIDLVCSRINLKLGKLLLEIVENKANAIGLKVIQIDSLPNKPLIKWYEKLGFFQVYIKNFEDGTEKAYFMQKLLI